MARAAYIYHRTESSVYEFQEKNSVLQRDILRIYRQTAMDSFVHLKYLEPRQLSRKVVSCTMFIFPQRMGKSEVSNPKYQKRLKTYVDGLRRLVEITQDHLPGFCVRLYMDESVSRDSPKLMRWCKPCAMSSLTCWNGCWQVRQVSWRICGTRPPQGRPPSFPPSGGSLPCLTSIGPQTWSACPTLTRLLSYHFLPRESDGKRRSGIPS
jgi:hypothetical protein